MSSFSSRKELAPPLLGCLYCHAEGTITELAARKLLGLGSDFPVLVCSHCQSVALFDEDASSGHWRIRYRRYNRSKIYFFSAWRLGKAGWLEADEALKRSTTAFIQRQRVRQAQRGDLSWLAPQVIWPPPPSFSPSEQVYLIFKYATLRQEGYSGREGSEKNNNILDGGTFYITDARLHLMGRDRDWSYEYGKVRKVDFSDNGWKIELDVKEAPRYFQCESADDEMDPQLASAVINALWHKTDSSSQYA
jgi:hypothetical protein